LFSSLFYDSSHKIASFTFDSSVELLPTSYYRCDLYFDDGTMATNVDTTIEYLNGSTVVATTNNTERKLIGANAGTVTGVRWLFGGTARTTYANKTITGFRCYESDSTTDISTTFEPYVYGYKLKRELDVYLPSDIYCAVGRTVELYNRQVCLQSSEYNLQWTCTIGRPMKRKFTITGLAGLIGNYTLYLKIFADDLSLVWYGATTIHIVDATLTNTYNGVTIGDSVTAGKFWLWEVQGLSNDKIHWVGKIPYTMTYNEVSQTVYCDGRGGFSAASYLAATTSDDSATGGINEGVHAFWDNALGRFSWDYYVTNTLSGVSPDFVQIFLGTNGMALDPTINANNIKQIIDYIRQDDASIPIYVVNTLFRASQDGIGKQGSIEGYTAIPGDYKYREDKEVMNLMTRLNDLLSAYSDLYFVSVASTFDSEYNYGAVSTPVNPRSTITELLPVEGTHPNPNDATGYGQIADTMFSTYVGTIE
jgi:hypothetical protein